MEGHNARSCPNASRDQSLRINVDNLTEYEAAKLQAKFITDKGQNRS